MKDGWQKTEERSFSFTLQGKKKLAKASAFLEYRGMDDQLIYQTIRDDVKAIPFCDYLKRYIYLNSGMSGSYKDIPLKEYRQTLMDAFRENGVPASMDNKDVRLATGTGRWLEQTRTGRDTVLLLGFGLRMLAEEVDDLLMTALHGHRLDPEDPLEGICRYCYIHNYGFDKMRRLRQMYAQGPSSLEQYKLETGSRLQAGRIIRQDRELLEGLFNAGSKTAMKRRTEECFQKLVRDAQRKMILESSGQLNGNVSAADMERVFCPPVFRDRYGNLKLSIRPELRQELSSKRFTRQHLHLLLSGKKEPDRYDLLTLGFYMHAGSAGTNAPSDVSQRVKLFEENMNRILDDCGYGPVYTADPYECYLMMSLASDDPMEAYSNVMEMALDGQGGTFG